MPAVGWMRRRRSCARLSSGLRRTTRREAPLRPWPPSPSPTPRRPFRLGSAREDAAIASPGGGGGESKPPVQPSGTAVHGHEGAAAAGGDQREPDGGRPDAAKERRRLVPSRIDCLVGNSGRRSTTRLVERSAESPFPCAGATTCCARSKCLWRTALAKRYRKSSRTLADSISVCSRSMSLGFSFVACDLELSMCGSFVLLAFSFDCCRFFFAFLPNRCCVLCE